MPGDKRGVDLDIDGEVERDQPGGVNGQVVADPPVRMQPFKNLIEEPAP